MSFAQGTKEMPGWMVRNYISREVNIVIKKYKILIRSHIEYCNQALAKMSRHGNWKKILRLEIIQGRVTKLIKRANDYRYGEILNKIKLPTLIERRMREDLIKILEIIYGIFNYIWYFSIFLFEQEIYC